MVPAFLVQESESSSAGSPPIAPRDNTLNRAMNALRKKDKLSKPSSAGRVSGKGCSTKWSDYYSSTRKEKGSGNQAETQLQEKMAEIPRIVEQQVGQALNNMMPSLFVMMRDLLASGQQGLPPMPSFTSSNSNNALVSPMAATVSPAAAALVSPAVDALVSLAAAPAAAALVTSPPATPAVSSAAAALVTSAAATPAVSPAAAALVTSAADVFVTPTATRALERRTPDTSGASAPSVTCPPVVGGPSTLAELDAITVTKPRPMTSSSCL